MKANKLRKMYLDFFISKKHKIVNSSPIIVKDDPTLMFTNAGMNQFKNIFLGDIEPKDLRVANSQKCLRVSGKHNDLEQVGHDTYHHTMFEMLGSWSFGDYFKEDAIHWAWEFLTDICRLDKERLYVTVFQGSKQDALEEDIEAYNIWKDLISKERIIYGNKKDNFWEMGETGPCGPCSEIHYDNRNETERAKIDAVNLVNNDDPQVIEIWNLVFMQYNRFTDGSLASLPSKHVDTGMGFERLTMIMQGVCSNYDTDIFQPIIQAIANHANINYGDDNKKDIAMRVIADHIRAVSFSIADGQLPSNVKAGYVIRRILRRAVRYAYTFLDLKTAFMYELISILDTHLGSQFPEISSQKELISKVIKEEEESFLRTLETGLKRIHQIIQESQGKISGENVFELYDTYGFPADLTALILSEENLSFSKEEFTIAMNAQKTRSKQAGKIVKGDWNLLLDNQEESFIGYNKLESNVTITRYREVNMNNKRYYQLVFDRTPFYPEGGGQIGDTGIILNKKDEIHIFDCLKENNLIIHLSNTLPKDINATFIAKVDVSNRMSSSRNHTATHLLHASLRNVLGDHVIQKGSLVKPDYLRFDFSHFSKIEQQQLKKIEDDINSKILANITLVEHNVSLEEAKEMGAVMLFGEKYGDKVRVIQFNTSKELCGGTHVGTTGEIGVFKILSEGSISSGIRRIEAVTGMKAIEYFNDKESIVTDLEGILKNNDLIKSVQQLLEQNKVLSKKISALKQVATGNIQEDLLGLAIELNKIRFIARRMEIDADDMKSLSFALRKQQNLVVILAIEENNKALLSVMITDDLVEKGLDASKMIKDISEEINGGGGGQPFFATAGGKNPDGIEKAFEKARTYILELRK